MAPIPPEMLEPGERLLWSARPRQGLRFDARDWVRIPVSILVLAATIGSTAISGYALYSAFKNGDTMEIPFLFLFPLIGLAFCAVAYQYAIGRFFKDAAMRAQTFYALSNKRAFVAAGGQVEHLAIADSTTFLVEPSVGGYGTLRFTSGQTDGLAFADAPDLAVAVDVIRQIQEGRA